MADQVKRKYGWYRSSPDIRDIKYGLTRGVLRSSDLRSGMPPVYNQGQTSSCTGNSIAAAFEYELIKQGLFDWTPSRLFIYWNERVIEHTSSDPDAGATIRDSVCSILYKGVPSEKLWPFDETKVTTKPSAEVFTAAAKNTIDHYAAVPQNLTNIVSVLDYGHPILFGTTLYTEFEGNQVASNGIVSMPSANDSTVGGHAMLIVGADMDNKRFIVRNSWGADWGDKGYCYFPFDYMLHPDLSSDFWVITGVKVR